MERRIIDQNDIEKAFLWLNNYWDRPSKPLYYRPKTVEEALSLLEDYKGEAKIIAGGIDLIGLLKNKIISPKVLISLKNIENLRYIREDEDGINIGSLSLIDDISSSPLIKEKIPMLSELCRLIGSPQIRNMATIGGNLCQEVRCWYYRRPKVTGISFNCKRKGGSICYALDGENQYHAIFGEYGCVAVCPSDIATCLMALDGDIQTISPRGERIIPIGKFYKAFGNILEPDEVIINIHISKKVLDAKHNYIKFRERNAIDFSVVSVYTVIHYSDNVIKDAKIALGGVSQIPHRITHTEKLLLGKIITEKLLNEVAEASVRDAVPLKKNRYKVSLVKALVKRSLIK